MVDLTIRCNHRPLRLVVTALVLASCDGGDGTGFPTALPPASFGANFSEIQANVFTPTCAVPGCHLAAGAPQGLRLDEANSFALLVGVPSGEVPAVLRVAAGDPNNSYLVQKLEGTAAAGQQMPLNRTPLDQVTIDAIRQWITDGAIDDRPTSAAPIRVASLSPMPGSTVTSSPTKITAMFDREPDASTVNLNTFLLEASGGDGTFGDGNETQVLAASIGVPLANPMIATFDLTGTSLANDTYRVRLLGSGGSMIMDQDANALGGEFTHASPSGGSATGGDFEAQFTVMAPEGAQR